MHEKSAQGWEQKLTARVDGSLASIASLREQMPAIAAMCEALAGVIAGGGTIYTAGNGGSAAQALHLAEELIGRYRSNRPALRAVCLNADPTAMTCIANDFGFEEVFARQASSLVTADDALVVLSTSGKSENIIRAIKAARQRSAMTVGLLGSDGGSCASLCTHKIIVAGSDSALIQDAHQVLLHLMCERLEVASPGA